MNAAHDCDIDAIVPINRGSGPNGCFMKDDILELRGTKFIPVLAKLPMPCEHMETTHDETNKSTFSVLFVLDAKSIRCSFPGCSFSHDMSKVHCRTIINHSHVTLHATSHRPKDDLKDDCLKRKKQSLLNNFFQTKKKCINDDDIGEMNDDVIREMKDPIITALSDDIRETMVRPHGVLSCCICMSKRSNVIAKHNEVCCS